MPEKPVPPDRRSRLIRLIPAGLFLLVALGLPVLRATHVIHGSWAVALAPFTLAGVIIVRGHLVIPSMGSQHRLSAAALETEAAGVGDEVRLSIRVCHLPPGTSK